LGYYGGNALHCAVRVSAIPLQAVQHLGDFQQGALIF
jgi:hypothetical protein